MYPLLEIAIIQMPPAYRYPHPRSTPRYDLDISASSISGLLLLALGIRVRGILVIAPLHRTLLLALKVRSIVDYGEEDPVPNTRRGKEYSIPCRRPTSAFAHRENSSALYPPLCNRQAPLPAPPQGRISTYLRALSNIPCASSASTPHGSPGLVFSPTTVSSSAPSWRFPFSSGASGVADHRFCAQ